MAAPPDLAPSELDTQIALQDYRLRVLNHQPVTAAEYHQLIRSLQGNRESRAKATAAASKAGRKSLAAGPPVDLGALFGGGQP